MKLSAAKLSAIHRSAAARIRGGDPRSGAAAGGRQRRVSLMAGPLLLSALIGAAAPTGPVLALESTASAAAAASLTPATPAPSPTGTPSPAPSRPPAASTATLTSTRQIVLELGKRTISLIDGDKVLGRWPVAIGDPATPTPTGSFRVRNKVVNPQYQSTKTGKNNPTIGPNGPLGDRWIGFHTSGINQFGIHGTPPAWEWTVKQREAVSSGCVRMLTPHVRALFDQVEVGTPVVVRR
ncbi:MAG: L,D-transpeptidase [Cyanobium sp.]